MRDRRQQRQWLWAVGTLGITGGLLLWMLLVAVLTFGGGDWLAALPPGAGPWQAGAALMQRAHPAQFDRVVRLYKACPQDSTTEVCEAALAAPAARTIPPGHGKPERPHGR